MFRNNADAVQAGTPMTAEGESALSLWPVRPGAGRRLTAPLAIRALEFPFHFRANIPAGGICSLDAAPQKGSRS